jgi:Amt family ammonium transporter
LLLLKIDDPCEAFPVHGGCGLWGCIAVGLFARKEYIEEVLGRSTDQYGCFFGGGGMQLGVQIAGVCAIIAWSSFHAFLIFGLCKLVGLLRISESKEKKVSRDKADLAPESWARVEMMDNGKLDQFQFKVG